MITDDEIKAARALCEGWKGRFIVHVEHDLRDLSTDPSPGVRAAAAEALEDAIPLVAWRDGQASAGPLNLSVWEYGGGLGGFGWAVSFARDIAACHWRHPLPTIDAAKSAAIAAARAWRDSIRL